MKYLRRQNLNLSNVLDDTILQTVEGNIELNPKQRVVINGDLNILGGSAPGPEVTNIMYVTVDGNDSNTGLGEGADQAKRTIKAAVAAAQEGTTIFVRSGEYYEDNPIRLPPKVSIIGDNLRRTILRPLNGPKKFNVTSYVRSNGIVTITVDTDHEFRLHDRVRVTFTTSNFGDLSPELNDDAANIIDIPSSTSFSYKDFGNDLPFTTLPIGTTGLIEWAPDFFLVTNQSYIAQLVFKGLAAPAYCVNIDKDAIVDTSPYIQNCSNINGPWLRNGTEWLPFITEQPDLTSAMVKGPRPLRDDEIDPAQVDQFGVNDRGAGGGMLIDGDRYNSESPIKSMVADAFTQVAQGAVGFHITNFGYMQLVSCFAVFCDKAFYTTKGGYLSISNSVVDFGNYGFVADGYYPIPYGSGFVTNPYYSTVGSVTVNTDGAGYTSVPTVVIDPPDPGVPGGIQATATASIDPFRGTVTAITVDEQGFGYTFQPTITISGGGATIDATATANLSKNLTVTIENLSEKPQVGSIMFIGDNPSGYYVIDTSFPNLNFRYNEQKCRRDVDYMLQAVMADTAFGTNIRSIYAGRAYLRSYSSKVLSLQKSQTLESINQVKTEVLSRTSDPTAISRITENFDTIYDIINLGIPDVTTPVWTSPIGRTDGFAEAGTILRENTEFIQNQIVDWIATNLVGFVYDEAKCSRDVGIIVESVLSDLVLGTNYSSKTSGLAYLRSYSSEVTSKQKEQTIDGINRSRDIIISTLQDELDSEIKITELFKIVTDIIEGGSLTFAPDTEFTDPVGVASNIINSVRTLETNKTFIIDYAINYINLNLNPESIEGYSEQKCRRDVEYILDGIIFDLFYTGNSATVNVANSYFDAGGTSVISSQIVEHADVFEELKIVLSNLAPDTASQTDNLFDIVIDAIQIGQGSVPTAVLPDYTSGSLYSYYSDERTRILTDLVSIQSEVIEFLNSKYPSNFSYNETTCKRDIGYIVDALSYDLTYGGNTQTTNAALAYSEGSVIAGEVEQTKEAYQYWKSILPLILTNQPVPDSVPGQNFSNTVGNPVPEYYPYKVAQNLLQIIINVIDFGTGYVPEPVQEVDFNLADPALVLLRESVLDDTITIQNVIIDYLNTSYGGNIDVTVFPGIVEIPENTTIKFHNVSTISTGGTALEYVGAGVTYNALPFFGGEPIPSRERTEINNGKCFTVTNDQVGNFSVGPLFNVNALSGAVTIDAENLSLSGIASIGPFKRNGIPVGVALKEVSNSTNLVSSIGTQDINTVPTQYAVSTYVEDRYLNKVQSTTPQTVESDVAFQQGVTVEGDLQTNQTTFNLINTSATTVNAFGEASELIIGASSGILTVNNEQTVFNSTNSIQIPVGVTSDRDPTPVEGQIRYNSELLAFEGFGPGNSWGSLGGVIDVDRNTYIIAEFTPAANDNTLWFYNNGVQTLTITETDFDLTSPVIMTVNNTTDSIDISTGALVVKGGVGIANSVTIGDNLSVNGGFLNTTETNFNLLNTTATTVNVFGAATTIDIGATTGTVSINNALVDLDGDLNVDGGDITTSLQTFNLLNTSATTVNAFGAATDIQIGASTGTTNVNNNLDVDGDVNIDGGNLTVSTTTFNLANTTALTVSAFGAATLVDIGSNSGTTSINNNLVVDLDLTVDGGDILTTNSTFNLLNTNATTVNFAGAATNVQIGSASGTTNINNDLDVDGDINIDGGDLTVSTTEFNLANTTATTVNFAGSATTIEIGASSGTVSINNALVDLDGDLNVDGGDITTNQVTFNLLNTNATTVNFAGNSTSISIGAATGTTNIKNNLDVDGNIEVGGNIIPTTDIAQDLGSPTNRFRDLYISGASIYLGDTVLTSDGLLKIDTSIELGGDSIDTLATTFNLLDTTATTVNAFGAATTIEIGASSGTVSINNALVDLDGDLNVDGGDITTNSTTFNLLNTNATTVNFAGSATILNLGSNTGTLTINNQQTVFNSTDSIQIPVGDTSQRDATPTLGQIRYNSELSSFEGFGPGNQWGSLGGVKDVDGNTYIIAELSPAANDNTLWFYNDGVQTLTITKTNVEFQSPVIVTVNNTTDSTSSTTGALVVDGGVGVAKSIVGAGFVTNGITGEITTVNSSIQSFVIDEGEY